MSRATLSVIALVAAAMTWTACGDKKKCVDKSKPALTTCQAKADKLQQQINDLKLKLAQALANPGTIKLDPSVLTIDGKAPPKRKLREGTLSQQEVVRVVARNKATLQQCYTRALKRNRALHHTKLTLNVAFRVHNNGRPKAISVRPNHDARMIGCMKSAIKRWVFPRFKGQPVGVETPVTLRPKG